MFLSKNKSSYYLIAISLLLSCKGEDGAVGPSGLNSLIQTSTELAGSNCEFGGLKVESGIDNNANGTLEPGEVLKTDYVCSVEGKSSLTNVVDEPTGATCANGGIKIESGIDDDGDGILDSEEINITRFICNGVDGGYDEEIRLSFVGGSISGSSITEYEFVGIGLSDFDIQNYVGVDSVVLFSNLSILSSYNSNSTAFMELYNKTDEVSIDNSEISSNQDVNTADFIRSNNIFSNLPTKAVDLGVRIKSDINGAPISAGSQFLVLYRSN